jgi:uncharacterized protein YukE
LSPDLFWEQTPATFNAAIRGRQDAEQGEWERALFIAYHSAVFQRADKLKTFSHYLAGMRPQRKLTADEVLARFDAMAAAGLDVKEA